MVMRSIIVNGIWIVAPVSTVIPIPEIVPAECVNLRNGDRARWSDSGLSAQKINEKLSAAPVLTGTDWLFEAMRVKAEWMKFGLTYVFNPAELVGRSIEIDRICLRVSGWANEQV